ncbi:MAG TPA: bifunctional folylpolyglutamate synthase/dihydrofolate synthase, partial [Sphingobacteriaceae bacterium]
PVVVGEKQDEVAKVFLEKAQATNSELVFASEQWKVDATPSSDGLLDISVEPLSGEDRKKFDLKLDLVGTYQLKNIKTVLSAVACLRKSGFDISQEHLLSALSHVQKLTGFAGRWQTLGLSPLIICDTGHNEDGIREVIRNIRNTSYNKLHMVIGMVRDKDIHKILQLLPKDAHYYFCQPNIERAKPVEELAEEASREGLNGTSYPSVAAALSAAKDASSAKDLIFVGGSTFVVAEIV